MKTCSDPKGMARCAAQVRNQQADRGWDGLDWMMLESDPRYCSLL
jgi:hypothetical protein